MTKFYDESNVLEITMIDPKTNEDFSADFFEDACNRKNYDDSLGAFKVEDVEYLVDYAKDYVAGTNRDFDYPEDYDPEESPLAYLDYTVEPLEKDPVILELAASLFDAGWRSEDKEEIKGEIVMKTIAIASVSKKHCGDVYNHVLGLDMSMVQAVEEYKHSWWRRADKHDKARTELVYVSIVPIPDEAPENGETFQWYEREIVLPEFWLETADTRDVIKDGKEL